MSFENALEVVDMPMNSFAFSIRIGSSSKFVRLLRNSDSRRCSAADRFRLGTMEIDKSTVDVLRRISSVAKRVQRLSFFGKGMPEIASKTELLPEDWTTQIRGTPLKRAKVKGLLRNLMVVAGNSGLRLFLPQLRRYLDHDDEHVRSHAVWAIKKLENGQSSAPP